MITLHHCVSARSFRPLWALEEIGVPFTMASPYVSFAHAPYSAPRTYSAVDGGRSILAAFERLLAPLIADGRVRLRCEAPVERLIVEDGAVVGVEAGGEEHRLR